MSDQVLSELIARWKSLTDAKERDVFYQENIFPKVVEQVVPREQAKYPDPFPFLILPVGLYPEPLIISIRILRPEKVFLLYTNQSGEYLERIVQQSGLRLSQVTTQWIDETNVPKIYQHVKDIYERWGHPERVAVDISGGKKSMVGGCALAGALIGAQLFYMDVEYDPEMRKPKPGSEHLVLLDNPYDVFGDWKWKRVQELYAGLDYYGAWRALVDLQEETSTPEEYEARALVCKAYAHWDDWDIDQAKPLFAQAIQTIERYLRLNPNTPLHGQLPILRVQFQILNQLADAYEKFSKPHKEIESLSDLATFFPILGTLYCGAVRQEKRGKLDVAALLWYRLIELMSQQRLGTYGLTTGEPDYAQLEIRGFNLSDIEANYKKTAPQKKHVQTNPEEGLPEQIDLLKGYRLLFSLQDPFVQNIHFGNIMSKVNARNKSQFAHGFLPLSQKDYNDFRSLAEILVSGFLDINDISPERLEEYRFLQAL